MMTGVAAAVVDVRPRLVCAEDRYRARPGTGHSAAEAVVDRLWRHTVRVPGPMVGQLKGPWPDGVHGQLRARARVDHGRWLVDCPFDGCSSAQYASWADRRFFCIDCHNGGSGRWVTVDWPAAGDVAAVEQLLVVRPDERSRNWRPGETLDGLRAENTAHGIGV